MSTGLTDVDLGELGDRLIAEIGARLRNPKALSGAQLIQATKEVAKLTELRAKQVTPETLGGDDLDLFALVERLPAAQRKKHLKAERERLTERLQRVNDALN